MFVVVAVAIGMDGFRTWSELLPAFGFHAVSSVLGLQLLLVAAKRTDAQAAAEPAAEQMLFPVGD